MTAMPVLPSSGTLVLVSSGNAETGKTFESLAELRAWTPTFSVFRVQIFTDRKGYRPEATFGRLADETQVEDIDGVFSITTGFQAVDPVTKALAAYRWAYGDDGR